MKLKLAAICCLCGLVPILVLTGCSNNDDEKADGSDILVHDTDSDDDDDFADDNVSEGNSDADSDTDSDSDSDVDSDDESLTPEDSSQEPSGDSSNSDDDSASDDDNNDESSEDSDENSDDDIVASGDSDSDSDTDAEMDSDSSEDTDDDTEEGSDAESTDESTGETSEDGTDESTGDSDSISTGDTETDTTVATEAVSDSEIASDTETVDETPTNDTNNTEDGEAPSSGCGKPAGVTSGPASIDVSGKTREYILTLPDNYDENHPYKLIFAWHPWTGSAQQIERGNYYGLLNQADNQAIFVAGEGQDYQNQGLGWGNEGGEDFDFYHAMLDRFRSELCVDENRIFSTGFSFGAMFSFSLGCTSDSMLRAIVPMAGNTFTSGGCEDSTRSVAMMALIGVDDTLLDGHRDAVEIYVGRNGCTSQTEPMEPSWCEGLNQSELPCTCVSYQGCSTGYPAIECEYNAGHVQAPNPAQIWDFLAQF